MLFGKSFQLPRRYDSFKKHVSSIYLLEFFRNCHYVLCARISGVLALSVASEQLSGSHLYARVCGGNDLPSFIIAMLLINII